MKKRAALLGLFMAVSLCACASAGEKQSEGGVDSVSVTGQGAFVVKISRSSQGAPFWGGGRGDTTTIEIYPAPGGARDAQLVVSIGLND